MDTAQIIIMLGGAVSALFLTLGAIARKLDQIREQQITRCEKENEALRNEARAAVAEKNKELDEWKQIALGRLAQPPSDTQGAVK